MHQEGAGYLQYKCRQLRKASTDSTSYKFKRLLHQKSKKYKDLYFRLCIGTAFLQYYLLFLPLSFPSVLLYYYSLFILFFNLASMVDKMREARLRRFGHVMRRCIDAQVRRYDRLVIEGMRRSGGGRKKF